MVTRLLTNCSLRSDEKRSLPHATASLQVQLSFVTLVFGCVHDCHLQPQHPCQCARCNLKPAPRNMPFQPHILLCVWFCHRIQHRGVPNHSPYPRPNIVLVYHRQNRIRALTNTPGLLFAESARPAFARDNPSIDRNVKFVPGPVNHFAASHSAGGALLGEPDPSYLGMLTELPPTTPRL